MKKTIAVIGSTGLVGRNFISQALNNSAVAHIHSFSRRPTGITHPKLTEHLVDFNQIPTWANRLSGCDILFSAMGTTKAKAGSIEAQRKIDYDFQFEVAHAAQKQGTQTYILISSAYASADSRMSYPKMKGELERDAGSLGFDKMRVLRPGPLMGERDESRPLEALTIKVFQYIPLISGLESIKPVPAQQVARAALSAIWDEGPGIQILEAREIWKA